MKYTIYYFDHKATRMFSEVTDQNGNKSMVISSPYNFVFKDEIVAKIVDVSHSDDLVDHFDAGYDYHIYEKYAPIKAGDGVKYDDASFMFKAMDYGFIKYDIDKSQLILIRPLRIQKDKMKAYFIVHPTKFKKIPTIKEIEDYLTKKKIYTIVDKNELSKILSKIDLNIPKAHRVVVAAGKEPKNGYEEHFFPIINLEKKAGKILDNGSMDFREVNSIIEVKKRQGILKKIPAKEPIDGFDIFGVKAAGIMEEAKGYSVGPNIVPSKDSNIYASSIDGCLKTVKRVISVSKVSIINGDINYDSGNIDFSGSVKITGSVLPGFSVKAKGDIYVGKNVDDAIIEAGANVIIKLGIGGKGETRINAGGNLQAKFILNSHVEAMGIIEIQDSIINSTVFSNNKILVTDSHGKIIGGETTALYEIVAKISGVPKENKTILTVGKNIFIEMELNEIKVKIEPVKEEVEDLTLKLKSSFGNEVFSNPKGLIAILPAVKKKSCIELLSLLAAKNKELKTLEDEYKIIEEKLKFEHEPAIEISSKVYPGTLIKIKKSIRMINEELSKVKFFEDKESKMIKFSTAK